MKLWINWIHKSDKFINNASCKERVIIKLANNKIPKEVNSGYNQPTAMLALREIIRLDSSLKETEKAICELFFLSFDSTLSYHLQPTFLKQMVKDVMGKWLKMCWING